MRYIFFGHHKAATNFCNEIMLDVARLKEGVHVALHSPIVFRDNLERHLEITGAKFISYTNADYTHVSKMEGDYRGFHVIRDPRDTIISSYFSHRDSHPSDDWPELDVHRKKLKDMDEQGGMLEELKFSGKLPCNGYDLSPLLLSGKWTYDNPLVFEMRFEDLIKNPCRMMLMALRHMDPDGWKNPLDLFKLQRIVKSHTFKKLRKSSSRYNGNHYRKGKPGEWRDYFAKYPLLKEDFKSRFGDLVIQLGYESSIDW